MKLALFLLAFFLFSSLALGTTYAEKLSTEKELFAYFMLAICPFLIGEAAGHGLGGKSYFDGVKNPRLVSDMLR